MTIRISTFSNINVNFYINNILKQVTVVEVPPNRIQKIEACVNICKYDLDFLNERIFIVYFCERKETGNWYKKFDQEREAIEKDILIRKAD